MTATSNSERQNKMNKAIKLLTGIIVLSALTACAKEDATMPDQIMSPGNIHGTITDEEGNPINHIKVTITQNERPVVVYTSRRGEFIADMAIAEGKLDISLEDIDGEDNGGSFAPLSDMITVLENQEMITLKYQMIRATASENSQQL